MKHIKSDASSRLYTLPADVFLSLIEWNEPDDLAELECTCKWIKTLLDKKTPLRWRLWITWMTSMTRTVDFLVQQPPQLSKCGHIPCQVARTRTILTTSADSILRSCVNPLIRLIREEGKCLPLDASFRIHIPPPFALQLQVKDGSSDLLDWSFLSQMLRHLSKSIASQLDKQWVAPDFLQVHWMVLESLWVLSVWPPSSSWTPTQAPIVCAITHASMLALCHSIYSHVTTLTWNNPLCLNEDGQECDEHDIQHMVCDSLTNNRHLKRLTWSFPDHFEDDSKYGSPVSQALSRAFWSMLVSVSQLRCLVIDSETIPSRFWQTLLALMQQGELRNLRSLDCRTWTNTVTEFTAYVKVFKRAQAFTNFPGLLVRDCPASLVSLFAASIQMNRHQYKAMDWVRMRRDLETSDKEVVATIDPEAFSVLLSAFVHA